MIKRQHISFDHGPPVSSHSAGLAGVVGYLFFFFARLFQSVVCFFFSSVVVLSFFGENKTERKRDRERERETEKYLGR